MLNKSYLYTASRKEEEFYFDALLAIFTDKVRIGKHKSNSQINIRTRKPTIVANALHEIMPVSIVSFISIMH